MSTNSPDSELSQTIIRIIKEEKPQTVEQLVNLVRERLPNPEQEILDTILELQEKRKIGFTKQLQPSAPTFAAYMKTESALWYWVTLATALATTAFALVIPEDFYPWVYVRYVLGTIFILWLPGYAFIKALFPTEPPIRTSGKGLDTIERTALSLGMSLALVPIVGLILNYTPWGISLTPITLSLFALTLIFATAAIIREHQAKLEHIKAE